MTTDTIERLEAEFVEFPIMFADSVPTAAEVANASQQIGVPLHPDYEEFLLRYGGAMVGAYPIFGLRPVKVMDVVLWCVVDVTRHYRSLGVPGCAAWVIISEDHAGNPIGMDRDGAIWIHDHDFGGISPLERTFEEYIRVHCLELPRHD